VHVADVVFCECHVPVVVEQPGFDPGDVGGEPLAMHERNVSRVYSLGGRSGIDPAQRPVANH